MAIVHKSDEAREDLIEIWQVIAMDKPSAADSFLDRIESIAQLLAKNPGLGEIYRQQVPLIRRFPVGNYVLYFQPVSDGIRLVRVIHGGRREGDLV